jgi:2-C-methyl-D-erythritol 4-phosphate cytidylyltransferase
VAAGRGERFGRPKQFVELAGVPMAGWSVRTFSELDDVVDLIVVTEREWLEPMRELVERFAPATANVVVEGGASRQASVRNGLRAVPERCDAVFVHDGARPLVRACDVRAGMEAVREGRAAVLAAPAVDTIKVVDPPSRAIVATPDRRTLWAAQTPQFAMVADLARAHEHALREGVEATDDSALLERIGIKVVVVEASSDNFKVTHPEDVARAQAVLLERSAAPAT